MISSKKIYFSSPLLFVAVVLNFTAQAVGPESLPPWPGSNSSNISCNCSEAFACSAFAQRACASFCNAPSGE